MVAASDPCADPHPDTPSLGSSSSWDEITEEDRLGDHSESEEQQAVSDKAEKAGEQADEYTWYYEDFAI